MLDGRDSAWLADIAARLGYTPLNAAAYTAADILAKLLTVDGAGLGLDADLLDGRQGAEFALLSGANFTGPLRYVGTAAPSGGVDGDLYIQADTDAGTMRLWHRYRDQWLRTN